MTKFHYLALAYTLFWAAIAVYMLGLGRRLELVAKTLRGLKQRLGMVDPQGSVDPD
ncbi:MAG: hypothetical protein KJ970_01600 [Candidatus Eisenbacteria bacterium]|uniref:CcmD family protein n=1 Tax=Eiseniibacteriota bacterium TaxID=2212470 RepID=A0A948RRC9_UNCEI|nr:hypothetical protein [Candidatus Eisenbacteria bacterium]MBU1950146.1 hypothetical protein [Candidatus Eisenbacteria bacterium]MBU2689598.1 hypothetical protein [Candidatus Eisenbacteria bacterium]